jgi:hypothetical protein
VSRLLADGTMFRCSCRRSSFEVVGSIASAAALPSSGALLCVCALIAAARPTIPERVSPDFGYYDGGISTRAKSGSKKAFDLVMLPSSAMGNVKEQGL